MSPADSGSHQATPRQEPLPGRNNGLAELPQLREHVPPLPAPRSVLPAPRVSDPLPAGSARPGLRDSDQRNPDSVRQPQASALRKADPVW